MNDFGSDMDNFLTIKLRYFMEWCIKSFIQDFNFTIHDNNSWFVDDKILSILITDIFGGEWHWSIGKKKIGIETFRIGGKGKTYLKTLGGTSWHKLFRNWYVCIWRGKK